MNDIELIRRWIRWDAGNGMNLFFARERKLSSLSVSVNYIDVISDTKRFMGTLAICYGNTVLLHSADFGELTKVVYAEAKLVGMIVHTVSHTKMSKLRAVCAPNSNNSYLPNIMLKHFRRTLGPLGYTLPTFSEHKHIARAQFKNVFGRHGASHAIVAIENGRCDLYDSADEAMLEIMKSDDPDLVVVEI